MTSPSPQPTALLGKFSQLLSSTRRGARLARLLSSQQLHTWGVHPDVIERAEHIVAELASNAVTHGQVRGRDFRVALALDAATGTLRIEVTDARGEQRPATGRPVQPAPCDESGRGLLLIAALADRWGTDPYPPTGKTIWAETYLGPTSTETSHVRR
ncbi:ATP-binding protein [Streptomyces sp. NPDC057307]|uniref:ATP-binding protein n=1 Tax=Streptomyces sp. NPDC057307 TaxID=3346096 RepID=UPI0036436105